MIYINITEYIFMYIIINLVNVSSLAATRCQCIAIKLKIIYSLHNTIIYASVQEQISRQKASLLHAH